MLTSLRLCAGVAKLGQRIATIAKSFRVTQIGAQLDKDEHGKKLESQLPKS
jgi:hypothetical protein